MINQEIPLRVLALSGSLRAASINTALLHAASRLAPTGMQIGIYSGLGDLPLFNPDLESQLPTAIVAFHDHVAAADALIIASPEYAHGVSGVMKNALDWLVSFEPFVYKPVAAFNASPRAHHADDALREILKTMSAIIVEPASIDIPLLSANLTAADIVEHVEISTAIKSSLRALHDAMKSLVESNVF